MVTSIPDKSNTQVSGFLTSSIGLPLFIGEILLGRKSQKGAVLAFQELNSRKAWSLGGMLGVIASFFIITASKYILRDNNE